MIPTLLPINRTIVRSTDETVDALPDSLFGPVNFAPTGRTRDEVLADIRQADQDMHAGRMSDETYEALVEALKAELSALGTDDIPSSGPGWTTLGTDEQGSSS